VDEICVVIGHCSGCPLHEVRWYGGSCRPIKVNGRTLYSFVLSWWTKSLYFLVLSWWTNNVLDTFFFTFLCGMTSVLHTKAVSVLQYCNIYSAQESHKRNTVVPEVQKIVGCFTSGKTVGLGVSFKHCV